MEIITGHSTLISFHCSLRENTLDTTGRERPSLAFLGLIGIVTQMNELLLNPKEKGKMDLYFKKVATWINQDYITNDLKN